ncbi:hypothetical protein [Aquimarina mytili]|uniref:Uncharacterized protein n=1 Tax=Aquimarina mytili TaxID=874423 RepID=A0A937D9S8_9FLAO|nr:hypothetical protein [Aquimarina mytili]MBL0685345.1 hypothetical protein [Aquimarina mytili]
MARPVKMTVNNNTNRKLILKDYEAKHGKFTTNPPREIESTGSWNCSTKSGAMIGPKGIVTYEDEKQEFIVEFHYNHPYGGATSSYRVKPDPSDAIGYDIKGDFTGKDQDITFGLYIL